MNPKNKKLTKIIIVGAGGLGKETLFTIQEYNKYSKKYKILGFLDDESSLKGKKICGFPILGKIAQIKNYDLTTKCVIAIGDGMIRKKIVKKLKNKIKFETIIHPTAILSDYSEVGEGTIIQAYSIINPDVKIGNHVVVNYQCGIGHDTELKDFVTLQTDVHIGGENTINEQVYFGTSSSTIENISIGRGTIVGACSNIIKNTKDNAVYIGNPAKFSKKITLKNRPKL